MINYAIGKCFKASMSHKVENKLEDIRKWLETPLLSGGLEAGKSHTFPRLIIDLKSTNENKLALDNFLRNLGEGAKKTEASLLIKHLHKSIPSAVQSKGSKKYGTVTHNTLK
jgi:hypothetical protein